MAVRTHRTDAARLDNVEGVRADRMPAAVAPKSATRQPHFKMRPLAVARRP